MICAYDKVYLEKARIALGRMLDYGVYDLKFDITSFFDMFIQSGVAARFEDGDYEILVGRSGVELACHIIRIIAPDTPLPKPRFTANRSEEYWTGWALAYYQWETARTFSDIIKYTPISDIQALYAPYHEMDIRHFTDAMNNLYQSQKVDSNLKLLRLNRGLTQRELSELSGVPLRTLQQYEQRQKNINKAQAEYMIMLSKALYCQPQALLEMDTDSSAKSRLQKHEHIIDNFSHL
ncbi:MAG: helix-turn-helix domain-containing protein [Agathobacter sp.]